MLAPLKLPQEDLDHILRAVGPHWEQLRGQRILLTGGTGFIGKWLLGSFIHANNQLGLDAQIRVLSRSPESFIDSFPALRQSTGVEWLKGDVRNLSTDAASDCRFAIHAATDVVATSTPADILDTCIRGTQRIVDAMSVGTQARRLLLLSSGAIYGRTNGNTITEECTTAPDPLASVSAYGEGKRVSEMLCSIAAAAHPELEVSIARCFAFVGPHLPLDKHFAIGNFIQAAIQDADIQILGDGTPLRSYLYAADLASWLWTMLFTAPNNRAFNIGGQEAISIGDLAHRVNHVLNGKGKVCIAQTPATGAKPQAYLPSVERIASEMGLVATTSLDDAILRTAQWARQIS